MSFLVCLVFFSIVAQGLTDVCNVNDVVSSNINFTLFSRDTDVNGVVLNEDTYSSVNNEDLTTLIIHGWLQDVTKPWVGLMKDAYINTAPGNIILVDWSFYARNPDYFQAACVVPYVGRVVGDFIIKLAELGLLVSKLQMTAFSLGAHVSGAAGKHVYDELNRKVSRINGLEATNLEFAGKPIDQRLDATDADFVQAIHTNNNGYGYGGNYGTIDFQVNFNLLFGCGTVQPGCPGDPGVPNGGSILPAVFCPHIRAVAYYIESIYSPEFLGVECSSCLKFGLGQCNANSKTIMGDLCPFDESGVRYLNTNATSPFALG